MLGYPNGALKAWRGTSQSNSHNFGLSVTGKFIMTNLGCTGNEASVADCNKDFDCGSCSCNTNTEVAGIKCKL